MWGRGRTPDWFRWQFVENPYVERVPMVVAKREDRIVGAAPCLALPLRAGSRDRLALQPADWMVHPDHRRQGLSISMTERLLEFDVGKPVDLYFDFPTPALLNGLRKFGWRSVGTMETRYRIQHPGALVSSDGSVDREGLPSIRERLSRISSPLVRGYLRVPTPRGGDDPALTVGRYEDVPVDHLLELAARGDPVAAAVACTEIRDGVESTSLLDVLPRDGEEDLAAYRALLRSVVDDTSESAALTASGDGLPAAVLDEFGFLSDGSLPLSSLSKPTRLAVRPGAGVDSAKEEFAGIDPTDADRWSLPLADQDVA